MKNRKKAVIGLLTALCFLLFGLSAHGQIINEVQANQPGGDLTSCEFIELRSTAPPLTTGIGGGIYIVEFEGDGAGAGTADFVRDISGDVFGVNGILMINGTSTGGVCLSRDYTSGGGNLVSDAGLSLENGTISFLLISSPSVPITVSTDYDTDNNGTLEALPMDAVIIDAIGWTDGSVGDQVYGGVILAPGNTSGPPDAATRDFNNQNPLDPTAWFADDIVGSTDSVSYDLTNLGGFMTDFMTPGNQNLAPTAAAGTISGRARNSKGRGIKFVNIMLSGGNLAEPIYATTNHFGYYRFENLPVGQSYVLQVISGRHTFQTSSILVNLDDSIFDLDFVTIEPGGVNPGKGKSFVDRKN